MAPWLWTPSRPFISTVIRSRPVGASRRARTEVPDRATSSRQPPAGTTRVPDSLDVQPTDLTSAAGISFVRTRLASASTRAGASAGSRPLDVPRTAPPSAMNPPRRAPTHSPTPAIRTLLIGASAVRHRFVRGAHRSCPRASPVLQRFAGRPCRRAGSASQLMAAVGQHTHRARRDRSRRRS